MTTTNATSMWDFRISAEGLEETIIIKQLKSICKKYVFQLEKGEQTGYLHYQGRMSLVKKHRKTELMKLFNLISVPNYLEPTVNTTFYTGDMFYVTKEETRQAGPWNEKENEKYIPRQYVGMLEKLYPFQKHIYESSKVFDTRTINMIYCPNGNVGKTTIASVCQLYGSGLMLPPVNDAEKLVQAACDICMAKATRTPSPIFIDMPRSMNKERLNGVYSAIEQIKNGYLYDLRYCYKEYWIDSPCIWVFSNIEPEFGMLSMDRWKVWNIDNNHELIPYVQKKEDTFDFENTFPL